MLSVFRNEEFVFVLISYHYLVIGGCRILRNFNVMKRIESCVRFTYYVHVSSRGFTYSISTNAHASEIHYDISFEYLRSLSIE